MFVKDATLLLNLCGTTMEDIIDSMLEAVFYNRPTNENFNNMNNIPNPTETDPAQISKTHSTTTSMQGSKFSVANFVSSDKANSQKTDVITMIAEAKKSLLMQISFQGFTCKFTCCFVMIISHPPLLFLNSYFSSKFPNFQV